jgi:hypothetical protein
MGGFNSVGAENLDSSLDAQDYDDLDSGAITTKELADEIEGMRKSFISRTEKDSEGVVSEIESHRFVKEAKGLKSREELARLEREFAEHVDAQRNLMREAGKILRGGTEVLDEGEDEEILEKFPDMTLKQKEKELQRLEKMLQEREKALKDTKGLDDEIKEKLKEELKDAKTYSEKLKAIESANESNKLFQKYKKLWDTDKISDKTKTEYFEWFLSLSSSEQKWAVSKAKKEDIEPREALHDLHDELPAKYQDTSFEQWGKTNRIRHLSRVERQVDQEFMKLAWSKDTDMSSESKAFAVRSFEQLQGKNPKTEGQDRILEKIKFLKEFPSHSKAEADLRTQLEKFNPETYNPFMEQFNRGSFEDKVKVIEKVEKLDEKMRKTQEHFNKFDEKIRDHFEAPFSEAKTPKERGRVLDQMEVFKEKRKEYFGLRKANDKYFSTSVKTYEDWYDEHVTNVNEATKAVSELKKMARTRKKLHESFKKLDKRVQARCPKFDEMSTDQKTKEVKKLQKLEQNLEAIDALKETAETLEASGMQEKALDILKKARKLDPEDKEIVKNMKRLLKLLGREKEAEAIKEDEVEEVEVKKTIKAEAKEADMVEEVDELKEEEIETGKIDFGTTEIRDMRRSEETVEMVEDNVTRLGGKIQEDAKTRAAREYQGDTDLEQEIIDEVTDEKRIIGRGGEAQEVLTVDFANDKPKTEDLRTIQEKITSARKRDVRRGALNVQIKDKSNVMKTDRARQKVEAQQEDLVSSKVESGIRKLSSKGVEFSDEQMEAVQETMQEQAEEELQRRTETEKIYKQST